MTALEMEQEFLRQWRELPPERQRELLDFAEYLQQKVHGKRPRRSLLGFCADLKVDISSQEIDDARKELWNKFPRAVEA